MDGRAPLLNGGLHHPSRPSSPNLPAPQRTHVLQQDGAVEERHEELVQDGVEHADAKPRARKRHDHEVHKLQGQHALAQEAAGQGLVGEGGGSGCVCSGWSAAVGGGQALERGQAAAVWRGCAATTSSGGSGGSSQRRHLWWLSVQMRCQLDSV